MRYDELSTDKARIAYIREKLSTDEQWILRGLIRIYERQTADEQREQMTRHWNSVGFTGADGEILTSFAQRVLRGGYESDVERKIAHPIGHYLTPKQEAILRRRMPKYARQLVRIAKGDA